MQDKVNLADKFGRLDLPYKPGIVTGGPSS
jgi:hypothetical protein